MSVLKLLASLNETMAVGKYDLWREKILLYGAMIRSSQKIVTDYFVRIFRLAIDTCERNYSAFQFVLWAGQSPHEAIQNVIRNNWRSIKNNDTKNILIIGGGNMGSAIAEAYILIQRIRFLSRHLV